MRPPTVVVVACGALFTFACPTPRTTNAIGDGPTASSTARGAGSIATASSIVGPVASDASVVQLPDAIRGDDDFALKIRWIRERIARAHAGAAERVDLYLWKCSGGCTGPEPRVSVHHLGPWLRISPPTAKIATVEGSKGYETGHFTGDCRNVYLSGASAPPDAGDDTVQEQCDFVIDPAERPHIASDDQITDAETNGILMQLHPAQKTPAPTKP